MNASHSKFPLYLARTACGLLAASLVPFSLAFAKAESAAPREPDKGAKFDWSKVPPISPMPRLGSFIVSPSGPGYYSLWDQVTGAKRKDPPISPYAPFGLFPPASFDEEGGKNPTGA